jgi:hypothetical protein
MKILSLAVSVALLAACGGPLTYTLKGSPQAPEADVKLVADVHKGSDFTTLNVTVQNLVDPARLGDGKSFVVWTKDDKPKWHRVAALKYDASSRKGTLEGASVPVESFDFKITAEKSDEPELPSDFLVVAQHVN